MSTWTMSKLFGTCRPYYPGPESLQPEIAEMQGDIGGGLRAVGILEASQERLAEAVLLCPDHFYRIARQQ